MAMHATGRVRWRSKRSVWGRELLVLQMEWTGTVPEHWGSFITMEDRTEWRDAKSEDVSSAALIMVGPNPVQSAGNANKR
jgi:hypothetical protein